MSKKVPEPWTKEIMKTRSLFFMDSDAEAQTEEESCPRQKNHVRPIFWKVGMATAKS